MRFEAMVCGIVLAIGTVTAATAKPQEPTLRDKEQAACYNDAQKLCSDAIPDEDKITACMETKRADVSAGCLKFFK